jgi:hypothetical protein
LGISVWAIMRTNAAERRKDSLRARGIAVAIYPELLKLTPIVDDIRQRLVQLKKEQSGQVGQSIAWITQTAQIAVPPMLERNVDNLYLLDEPAGPACLQLVNILLQYNTLVADMSGRIIQMNAQQWPEAIGHFDQHLDLVASLTLKSATLVQKIHDRVQG